MTLKAARAPLLLIASLFSLSAAPFSFDGHTQGESITQAKRILEDYHTRYHSKTTKEGYRVIEYRTVVMGEPATAQLLFSPEGQLIGAYSIFSGTLGEGFDVAGDILEEAVTPAAGPVQPTLVARPASEVATSVFQRPRNMTNPVYRTAKRWGDFIALMENLGVEVAAPGPTFLQITW